MDLQLIIMTSHHLLSFVEKNYYTKINNNKNIF